MRMRAKKNRINRFEKVNYLFADVDENGFIIKNNNKNELWAEIGCGKGTFAVATAKRNENVQMVAVEVVTDVLLMAMEKSARCGTDNLTFLNGNADKLESYFAEKSLDRIILNFSDPWPKKKHEKRRLTSPDFLKKYKSVLKDGGKIYFKTDNRPLFDYSLGSFAAEGFVLNKVLFDLHSSELDADNIRTEYEENFSAKGFKINYLEACLCRE